MYVLTMLMSKCKKYFTCLSVVAHCSRLNRFVVFALRYVRSMRTDHLVNQYINKTAVAINSNSFSMLNLISGGPSTVFEFIVGWLLIDHQPSQFVYRPFAPARRQCTENVFHTTSCSSDRFKVKKFSEEVQLSSLRGSVETNDRICFVICPIWGGCSGGYLTVDDIDLREALFGGYLCCCVRSLVSAQCEFTETITICWKVETRIHSCEFRAHITPAFPT